jgi:hypothetical protein
MWILPGVARRDRFAQLYLDNALVATAPLSDKGGWRAKLTGIAAGVYTLRVDQVTGEGKVTSRVETPFQREEPAKVAQAAAPAAGAPTDATTATATGNSSDWSNG